MTVRPWWSVHTHSRYSANDAMPKVPALVSRAHELGYPAVGLTDHGTVSGVVQLYKECRKVGISPGPGVELYVTADRELGARGHEHLTVMATTEQGYRNLVGLTNLAAANFWYRPRVDFADLADLADHGKTEGLIVATGCYFGTVIQTLLHRGPAEAAQLVRALDSWFPRCFVELQHHGIASQHGDLYSEEDIIDELVAIATEVGVPWIVTQDSHYLYPDEQRAHNALKELVSFSEDPSEATFPGDPYCMVDVEWLRPRFPVDVLDTALDQLHTLAESMAVRIPELDTFSMKVPDVSLSGDPYRELADRIAAVAAEQTLDMPAKKAAAYRQEADDELAVVKEAGLAGYLLLVASVCDFMYERDIWFLARGSASGSLLCYWLGITQEDPVEWVLRADRFMSRDRTRPPDIDLDVEDVRRDEVVRELERRFSVRRVGSHGQMGMEDDEDSDGSGSLLVKYYSAAFKRTGTRIGWKDVPEKDRTLLRDLATRKLISGPGKHAAGYIVAPDELTVEQLPMTWIASSGALVTSYGKKDVEALGFVKLDLLGSTTLTAVRRACEEIAKTINDKESSA